MNNGETVPDNQQNTNIFCEGKTGFENVCGTYDKHAFPVSKTMMCNRFRITQTGINGNNGNYFVLSGFELFGEIYYSKASKCSAFNMIFKTTVHACDS